MNSREHEALATIGLLAAQADGRRTPEEQAKLAAMFGSFGVAGIGSVHAHVALGSTTVEDEAHALATPELRAAAWDLAVGVCRADGEVVAPERAFLERLRVALGLSPAALEAVDAPLSHALLPAPSALPAQVDAAFTGPASATTIDEAAIDETIRQAAVLVAALELLPQNMATLGIVPLQLKLVADIGAAYGYRVDASHAKELIATAGLGLGGQAIEGFARRLLGRLAGRFGGSMVGGVVDAATGATATFAATWAIGQVARSWYASGRALDSADVQARFARALEDGRGAFDLLRDTIEEKALALAAGAR
jgi:uncharacterized protein (DUF697 family)